MEPFHDVKKIGLSGASTCVYMNKIWGLVAGDMVDITIVDTANPAHKVVSTKKVCASKGNTLVIVNKDWGFNKGDLVQIQVQPREGFDRRVRDQEEDQEVS